MSSSTTDPGSPRDKTDKPGGNLLAERLSGPPMSEEHLECRLAERPSGPPMSEERLDCGLAEFSEKEEEQLMDDREATQRGHTFQPPDLISLPYNEKEDRLAYAQDIADEIKTLRPEFDMRGEDIVAILMVEMKVLEPNGPLSSDDSCDLPKLIGEEMTLDLIAQLGKHYMLHCDTDNLEDPRWQHAIPEPYEEQPEMTEEEFDEGDLEDVLKAIRNQNRFQTLEHLQPVRHNAHTVKAEEAKCLRRDSHMCVATGNPSSSVFWFIPFTWNDTVDHMNATGELRRGALHLAGVSLLDGPSPPCNARALGGSHKAWNMVCVDKNLCRYLKNGLCAFKYVASHPPHGGEVAILLEFHWMPVLHPRYGQKMNIDRRGASNDFRQLIVEIERFQEDSRRFQVSDQYGKIVDKEGKPLQSGKLISIDIPEENAEQFVTGVKVHWACVLFAALCGAAGKAWLLSGERDEDGSAQERQEETGEAEEEEEE